jgi:hypothetical protein
MRRPFSVMSTAATAAHHGFELGAGVGLVFQPYLGLGGAAALWALVLPGLAVLAAKGSPRADRVLSLAAGASLAGALVHFTLWPWRRRGPLLWLTAAEGLRDRELGPYNLILDWWALASGLALAFEARGPARRWGAAGRAAALPLRASARHHFVWLRQQARERPEWWNRAAVGAAPVPGARG